MTFSNGRHWCPFFCRRRWKAFTNIIYADAATADRTDVMRFNFGFTGCFRRKIATRFAGGKHQVTKLCMAAFI
ncbi:hypothetical protein AB9E15_02940 [Rhizobium leguminosarum]|uniref:hypothetical protein n=1 Tax=Rhizobium leguminosarum TaxID=384 RepID=UPI003F9D1325